MGLLQAAIDERRLQRLVLSKALQRMLAPGFVDEGPVLERIRIKPVRTKEGVRLAFDWHYDTRDQRSNLDVDQAMATVEQLLGKVMGVAVLETTDRLTELGFSKRGRPLIRSRPLQDASRADPPASDWLQADEHNRHKAYLIRLDRPYLLDLGVARAGGELVPAMARKWRQINRFVEILVTAWQNSPAASQLGRAGQPALRIQDFGAGKGYLTFALHDYLSHELGLRVETLGIERRTDLVALCNRIASRHGMSGLRFEQGDIAHAPATGTDWMIALHACDTATDEALYQGVRQQAAMLVCSPCCHRELRPQLLSPHPLRPLLRHGIHLGQEAEMLTDGLRALLLEAEGYDAKVFEFIALEHTSKNKMILASRAARPRAAGDVRAEVQTLKSFYGIRSQRLEQLLSAK